ncbi:hypothetical protein [Brevundimonas sp.]|nr:hypothetical protein [Brevundimonas sp.]
MAVLAHFVMASAILAPGVFYSASLAAIIEPVIGVILFTQSIDYHKLNI